MQSFFHVLERYFISIGSYSKEWNLGCNLLWGRLGWATAPSRPQFAPPPPTNTYNLPQISVPSAPQVKFIFHKKKLVETKISLLNSSIQRKWLVSFAYLCFYGNICLIFQFSLSFSLDLGKLALTLVNL